MVSCAPTSTQDCVTGGSFTASNLFLTAYVHEEFNGRWKALQPLPGLPTSGNERLSAVTGVSCSAPGTNGNNCVAVGYVTGPSITTPFIEVEQNGTWSLVNIYTGFTGGLENSVSCSTAGVNGGNCAVVFSDGGPLVGLPTPATLATVDEVDGTWGAPQSFVTDLPSGVSVAAGGISCSGASIGGNNCVAAGDFSGSSYIKAFTLEEVDGTWGAPTVLTDTTLNAEGAAFLSTVSCVTPTDGGNNCVAGGDFQTDSSGDTAAFVIEEVNGTWGSPNLSVLGGISALSASVNSVTCLPQTAGNNNCVAVGYLTDGSTSVGFVDEEINGVWDPSSWDSANGGSEGGGIPLYIGTIGDQYDWLESVSCGAPTSGGNNCVAVGMHIGISSQTNEPSAFTEVNGVWQAGTMPATALNDEPNGYGGMLTAVSCAKSSSSTPSCLATGYINGLDIFHVPEILSCTEQALNLSYASGGWSVASPSPAPASGCPTPARNVSASPLPFGAAVNWDAPVDSGGVSIDHYEVAYSSDGGTTWSTNQSASGTSLNVTDLSPQHSYLFRIIPVNLEGRTGDVTESTSAVTPLSATVPGAPTSVVVTTTKSAVSASWKPPVSNGGAPITSYTCTLMFGYNNPSSFTQKTTGPTCSFTGLTDPANYGVVVSATNSVGTTSATIAFAPSAATTTTTPAPHRTTITCHKGKKTRRVTGLNPHCPTGYHR